MEKRASLGYIITSLLISLLTHGYAFAASGEDIFKSKECDTCHSMTGSPAESIEDQQQRKGPDLWYAGSKYQEQWIESYLQNPIIVRPLAFGSIKEKNELKHSSLSAADAKAVTGYLASLNSTAVTKGAVTEANKGVRGKILLTKKQACYGCHQIPKKGDTVYGGYSGASLVDAGNRLQGDWMFSFLKDPKPFIVGGRMPHYKHLKDNEIKSITEYMMSFK